MLKLIMYILKPYNKALNKDATYVAPISILQMEYSEKNEGRGKINLVESDGFTKTGYDLFNAEDTNIQAFLKQYLYELQKKSA